MRCLILNRFGAPKLLGVRSVCVVVIFCSSVPQFNSCGVFSVAVSEVEPETASGQSVQEGDVKFKGEFTVQRLCGIGGVADLGVRFGLDTERGARLEGNSKLLSALTFCGPPDRRSVLAAGKGHG